MSPAPSPPDSSLPDPSRPESSRHPSTSAAIDPTGQTARPLRIGIACYPTYGGSGILATELGIALCRRGHEVHFLAYAELPRLAGCDAIKSHRVEVSAYPLFKYPPYDLALASKMRELMCEPGLDILHVHYAIPHSICAYLARSMAPDCRTKTVTTLHGTDITVVGNDEAYREVTRFGIEHSDRVIAVSQFLSDATVELFHTDKAIDVIPNFVDASRFRPGVKTTTAPFSVVHISNFRPVKRPRDVIHAFARIRKAVEATLTLVGDGPELPGCLELAKTLGVHQHVDCTGTINDVTRPLSTAHLLLQPSGSEAFGLAALEALACEVPVVGYRVGGLPDVVVDGVTGYLVTFKDIQQLSDRSIEILSSPGVRDRMGAMGRQRATELFSVERCVQLHEKLYMELLEGR